jgi:hypothetical protein
MSNLRLVSKRKWSVDSTSVGSSSERTPVFETIMIGAFQSEMNQISEFASQWTSASERHAKFAAELARFSRYASAFIAADVPDATAHFAPVHELFSQWSAVHSNRSIQWKRISNDIRDIVERHHVVDRAAGEYKSTAKALASATTHLAQLDGPSTLRKDSNPASSTADPKLRFAKKAALLKARDATIQLIEERKKFSRFQFRRTREAYDRLGKTLTESSQAELAVVNQLIEAVQQAKNGQTFECEALPEAVAALAVVDADSPREAAVILADDDDDEPAAVAQQVAPDEPAEAKKNDPEPTEATTPPPKKEAERPPPRPEPTGEPKLFDIGGFNFKEPPAAPAPDPGADAVGKRKKSGGKGKRLGQPGAGTSRPKRDPLFEEL